MVDSATRSRRDSIAVAVSGTRCKLRMSAMLMAVVILGTAAPPATAENVGDLEVRRARATGVARLVTPANGPAITVPPQAGQTVAGGLDFFRVYGAMFGITDPESELVFADSRRDDLGNTRTSYKQTYRGLPVFGTFLHVHQDASGGFKAAGGTFIPDIDVNPNPALSADRARHIALQHTAKMHPDRVLDVESTKLLIFRANLVRGLPGDDHLAWEVLVTNISDVRERVFVDAHLGVVIDTITEVCDTIDRVIYDGGHGDEFIVWTEGEPLTGVEDIDNVINFSEDSYNLFASATDGDYLSWDGNDITMQAVTDSPFVGCPNASWNGTWTNFCPGVAPDDVVGHEWAHAYTDGTHDLIYQWQSGALNESYSDIVGEVVDFLNGAGSDSPGGARLEGECSAVGSRKIEFEVLSPSGIAGPYFVGGASFNPDPPQVASGTVEYIDDGDDEGGAASSTDGCQALIGFTSGNIALIDRGTCSFTTKVGNAADAGASGVIIVNTSDSVFNMSGSGPTPIVAAMVSSSDGDLIKDELPGVTATITLPEAIDPSLRWLTGEDATGFGGAIRDMWNPTCFGDPGKVSDIEYVCGTGDNGGVHSNSGIPNHAFALLVDGGSYNGETVAAIGMTKAFHIYWQAMSVYQGQTSDFSDHADALELSCQDLLGVDLFELSTESTSGVPSGEVITASDCLQVSAAIAAVELRLPPDQCAFSSLLDPVAPPLCPGEAPSLLTTEDWESGMGSWSAGTRDVADPATFDTPDWAVVGDLPDGRNGSAAFVADLIIGNCQDDTEAGVLYLESSVLTIPPGAPAPRLAFEHWVSTEPQWDGGNLKISVNDGPWQLVPGSAFIFNTYPTVLNGGDNDNPMAQEEAFSGTDGGSLSGTWAQSQVDLSGLVGVGDDFRLRFEMGLDGCNGRIGWYVDEVVSYQCVACNPPACVGDLSGNGVVDASDLAQLLGAWGPNAADPANLNCDDGVDASDLAALLGNWGPCP